MKMTRVSVPYKSLPDNIALTPSLVADDELQFLIDTALAFRAGSFDGQPTVVFRDPDGDEDDLYEFVAGSGVNVPTIGFFQTAVLKAMYERKHQKSSETARDADLKKLMWK